MRQAFVSKGDEMHVICLDILFQSSDPEFIFTDQLARQNQNISEQVAKWDRASKRLKSKTREKWVRIKLINN